MLNVEKTKEKKYIYINLTLLLLCDQDVGGWTILKWILERWMGWSGVDWIDMAQDRDQWTALLNTVLNLRVP
jgi:hypothetical protein